MIIAMPTKIKLLPEQVANQIAAGEVVERPASVVKELVENALDAGARRVTVEIEQGGLRLIRVIDDGEGMGREDALLSLERHATSKLRKSADLFAIRSLGFRGEALPSIASVAELTLITRERDADAGVRIEVLGGTIKTVADAGAPPGTEIAVRRLFFNVPARRKFLKSIETELGHITHLVANMALARPDVHTTLIHNGSPLFDLPASPDLSGRLRHALGADAIAHLIPVDAAFPLSAPGALRVHGFVSTPAYSRASTRALHVFVNRRFVRDRLINHAVFEAYRTLLPRGRYPLVVLFLDLPAETVDVNVHPAKHEIRFQDQNTVHQAVIDAILAALRQPDRSALPPDLDARIGARVPAPAQPLANAPWPDPPDPRAGTARATERYLDRLGPQDYRSVPGYQRRGQAPRPAPGSPGPAAPERGRN
jgi:DNA mismatch repair protein MutL